MFKIILLLLLFLYLPAQDKYELGSGVQVASLPIYIGGYISVDYRNKHNENRYRIDDLAILSYGNYKKFSYMAELEYRDLYTKTYTNNNSHITRDKKLHIERLYTDYSYNEHYYLRVGKYNSPIGFWNLLPVNVLQATTSDPVVTHIIFPEFTTGINIVYSNIQNSEIKIDVMLQNNKDFDDDYNNYKIDKHYAVGLTYEKDNYAFKINVGHFSQINNTAFKNLNYALISAKYDTNKYQITGELGYQSSQTKTTKPYASYIQGLYRITPKHHVVIRTEAYKDNVINIKDNIAIFGYTYRPLYPLALKAEYQLHSLHKEDNLLFSFSVMF
ncbi:MAG: hypothetical protein QM497_08715 [Sulfurimonas sp.]